MADDRTDPQYKVRMPEELHARLKAEAEANKRSMNAEIVARLEESFGKSANDDLALTPGQQKVFNAMQESIRGAMRDLIARWDPDTDKFRGESLNKKSTKEK